MRIGEISKVLHLSTDTIRYYERIGLIPKAVRQSSGYRIFPRTIVARLRLVRSFQQAGLTLAEIGEVLRLFDGGTRDWKRLRPSLVAVLDRIQAEIRALQTVSRRLTKMISLADNESCPFLPGE
jgi:DNA-binding transcriptional MerR regulator